MRSCVGARWRVSVTLLGRFLLFFSFVRFFFFLSLSSTIDRRGLEFVSRERNGRGGNEGDKGDDQPSALANG